MGNFFGGKPKTQSTTPVRLNGIQINQSLYGNCVPLQYGTGRLPLMLVDYEDFKAIKQTSSSGGGGKGGSGNQGQVSFTYSATLIALLCEGPAKTISNGYDGSTYSTLSALGFTPFFGGNPQPTWQYMTQNHPTAAIPYDGWAYVAGPNYQLGGSAGLPNLTFEVTGIAAYQANLDAEPSAIITDYCTDPNHGAGFPYLAADLSDYRNYCLAMGFLISPQETSQRSAQSFLKEILQTTNSNAVYTAGVGLRLVPYGDQTVTGTLGTWVANLTPIYSFKDADYVRTGSADAAPVQTTDVPDNETWNVWNVEYLNRSNQYNTDIGPFKDSANISENGMRTADTVSLHSICNSTMAVTIASILCSRNLYIRKTYTFTVRPDFSALEPMDLVAINDSVAGIVNQLVRITATTLGGDDNETFTITAEEMFAGPASPPRYDTELAQGYAANYAADPGAVATPYIFTAPPGLIGPNGGYEEWIAVCGLTGNWGWASVYASLDNITYDFVGVVANPARVGSLVNAIGAVADPDTSSTLTVRFDDAQAVTVGSTTQAGADSMRTVAILGGEFLSWQTATPLGNNQYALRYLRRGLYNSNRVAHVAGERFAIIDDTIFRMPFDPGDSGLPVWFKFTSTNIYGGGTQDISKVPAYQAFFQGQNNSVLLPVGDVPLIASGNCSVVGNSITKWSSAPPGWGDAGAYSVDAFSGGCTAKFQPGKALGAFMLGLNSDPKTDNSYASIDYAWYINDDGNSYIWESGVPRGQQGPPYSLSDVFELRYDGKFVVYYINGVKYSTTPAPNKSLFLDCALFTPGAVAQNVFFGPLNPANASPFVARGSCIVSDENFYKGPGNGNNWDSDIYSLEGFPTCHISFKASQTNLDFIIGLSALPAGNTDPGSLGFGLYCTGSGTLWAVNIAFTPTQGGYPLPGTPPYTTKDLLAVTYDGVTISVLKNGLVIYTIPISTLGYANGTPMYLDSSWLQVGAAANTVQWGPGTALQFADTPQLGDNAATEIHLGSSSISKQSWSLPQYGWYIEVPILTVPMPRYNFAVIATVIFQDLACLKSDGTPASSNIFGSSALVTMIAYQINPDGSRQATAGVTGAGLQLYNPAHDYTYQGQSQTMNGAPGPGYQYQLVAYCIHQNANTTDTIQSFAVNTQLEFIKK